VVVDTKYTGWRENDVNVHAYFQELNGIDCLVCCDCSGGGASGANSKGGIDWAGLG
jgi:hypothetical protein